MAQTVVLRTPAKMKDLIKNFLETVCGFMADASKEITKNQGYDNLDKFYLLNDKGVDTLCSIVRKPHCRPAELRVDMPSLTLYKNVSNRRYPL
jgi:hypothetical protein